MGKVLVVSHVPNMSLGDKTHELMARSVEQSVVKINPMLIKPSCVVEAEKYFDNMESSYSRIVGLNIVQCANENLQNICMVSVPKGLVSVIAYANEVSKFYTELDEMCRGQSVNSDARELYRELYLK